MARMNTLRALRTTLAALESNAAADNLIDGELYFVTDKGTLAIGKGTNAFSMVEGVGRLRDVIQVTDGRGLLPSDRGKLVDVVQAAATNFAIADDAAIPVGGRFVVRWGGEGQPSLVAGAGVTLQAAGGRLKIAERYGAVEIVKMAANSFWAVGALAA